jgi:diguanylate cyclase (GGDEF)-like protein
MIRFYAGYPLASVEGEALGTLCILDQRPRQLSQADIEALEDLSSLVKAELNAIELATMDNLTQLANRRGFISQGQERLAWFQRHGVEAALVYLDLNGFKQINDGYGHSEGDRALRVFAEEMKRNTRSYDLLARLSGDEFVMLLGHVSKQQATSVAERMMRSLRCYCDAELPYQMSASYGVVVYQAHRHLTIEALLDEADQYMYQSKKKRHDSPH